MRVGRIEAGRRPVAGVAAPHCTPHRPHAKAEGKARRDKQARSAPRRAGFRRATFDRQGHPGPSGAARPRLGLGPAGAGPSKLATAKSDLRPPIGGLAFARGVAWGTQGPSGGCYVPVRKYHRWQRDRLACLRTWDRPRGPQKSPETASREMPNLRLVAPSPLFLSRASCMVVMRALARCRAETRALETCRGHDKKGRAARWRRAPIARSNAQPPPVQEWPTYTRWVLALRRPASPTEGDVRMPQYVELPA